jgi:hypothetical protein
VLPELARVSGSVTGSWQQYQVEHPRVEVWQDGGAIASATVEPDGQFDAAVLLGGPAKIVIWIDDMPSYVGGPDYDSATIYYLEPGDHVTGISRIESGLTLAVDGLVPLSSYYVVHIFDAAGHDLTRRPTGATGITGYGYRLPISNLTPGMVLVSLAPTSDSAYWLPQFYDRRETLAEADPILVPPDGGIAPVAVALVLGGRIRGHILGPDGEVATRNFDLQLFLAADPDSVVADYDPWDVDYDHQTGAYVIRRLPDGDYKLRARLHASPWRYWPGVESFADAGVITIENLGEVTGIDLTLPD